MVRIVDHADRRDQIAIHHAEDGAATTGAVTTDNTELSQNTG